MWHLSNREVARHINGDIFEEMSKGSKSEDKVKTALLQIRTKLGWFIIV